MPTKERRSKVPPKKRAPKTRRVAPPRLICEPGTKDIYGPALLHASAGVGRGLNQSEFVHALIAIGADHLDEVIAFLRDRDEDLEGDGSDE